MPAIPAGPPQPGGTDASNATPEQLYLHVVGRWPGPELGYPADHSDMHGQGGALGGTGDDLVAPDQADDGPGSSARAKKRRKVQRRAKVSEIWFPRAEMAFCTCVASIPPNGRTKIKFFGRPLGRNELIAAICTLATRRMYNRKQISSHSQVLKDKVPAPLKEIFTFEDKSRVNDDHGESSTANVIENYVFPDSIYNIIGYRVGSDLANAPKPKWLSDLEAGVSDGSQAPPGDSSTPRPYSYWANGPSDYPTYYDRGGSSSGGRIKQRDGRGSSSSASGMAMSATSMDSPYYPYSQQSSGVRPPAPFGPPPHTFPSIDGQGGDVSSLGPSRFSVSQPGAAGSVGAPPGHSRPGQPWAWDEQNRSPTSTSSYDTHQSQGSATTLSPRQPAWPDSKPDITLPPLPDGPSSPYNDWKDRMYADPNNKWGPQSSATSSAPSSAIRGGALPSLSAMPSFGTIASQTNNFGVGQTAPTPWGNASGVYGAPGWEGATSATRTRTDSISRLGSFIPASLEVTAQTADSVIPLTSNEQLTPQPPVNWWDIYMWNSRYPFLQQVAQAPGVPVYHIDVPFSLPTDSNQRQTLGEGVTEFGLHIALRPLVSETTGWAMTSDSGFVHATTAVRYPRSISSLRPHPSGELTGSVRLGDLARLYEHFVHTPAVDERRQGGSLASVALPMSVLIQRVVRDDSPDVRTPPQQSPSLPGLGSDWASAAAIIIYSFWAENSWSPPGVICRPVDFDGAPASENVVADQLAAGLLAGEEEQPSKFDWM